MAVWSRLHLVPEIILGCRAGGRQDKCLQDLLGGCITTLLALQYSLGPKQAAGLGSSSRPGSPAPEASQPTMQLLDNALEKLQPEHSCNNESFAAIQTTMTTLRLAVGAP